MPPFASLRGQRHYPEVPWYLGKGHGPFSPLLDPIGRPRLNRMSLTLGKDVPTERLADRTALLHSFDSLRRDLDAPGAMDDMPPVCRPGLGRDHLSPGTRCVR